MMAELTSAILARGGTVFGVVSVAPPPAPSPVSTGGGGWGGGTPAPQKTPEQELAEKTDAPVGEMVRTSDGDYYYKAQGTTGGEYWTKANIVGGEPYNPYEAQKAQEISKTEVMIGGKPAEVVKVQETVRLPTGDPRIKQLQYRTHEIIRDPTTGKVLYDPKTDKVSSDILQLIGSQLIFMPTGQPLARGVESAVYTPSGYLKNITITDQGKKLTYDPFTGEVKRMRTKDITVDFKEQQAFWTGTAIPLDVMKKKDYEALASIGIKPTIPTEAKKYSDWYVSEVEGEAARKGAKSLALQVQTRVNVQYHAEYIQVKKTDKGYVLSFHKDVDASAGMKDMLKNALATYGGQTPYADVEALGGGKFLISQKDIEEPSYLFAKHFTMQDMIPTEFGIKDSMLNITFGDKGTFKYSELSKEQQQAFDVSFKGEMRNILTDIEGKVADTYKFSKMLYFEKEGGEMMLKGLEDLPKQPVPFSLDMLRPLFSYTTQPDIEFKQVNGKFMLHMDDKPYSSLTKKEKEYIDTATREYMTTPAYTSELKKVQIITSTTDIGIKKTGKGWEFKGKSLWDYATRIGGAGWTAPPEYPQGFEKWRYGEAGTTAFNILSLGAIGSGRLAVDVGSWGIQSGQSFITGLERWSGFDVPFMGDWGKKEEAALQAQASTQRYKLDLTAQEIEFRQAQSAYLMKQDLLAKTPKYLPSMPTSFSMFAGQEQLAGYRIPTFEGALAYAGTAEGFTLTSLGFGLAGKGLTAGKTFASIQKIQKGISGLAARRVGWMTGGEAAKFFVITGAITTGIEEVSQTLVSPEYKPFEKPEESVKTFIAGGVSGVVFGQLRSLATIKLDLIPKGGLASGLAVHAKRVAAGAGAGFPSGAAYSAGKNILSGEEIDVPRAIEYGAMGAVIGAGIELGAIGFEKGYLPKPVYGKVEYQVLYPTPAKQVYRGFGIEWFGKAKPLVGFKGWKPTFGAPTFETTGAVAFPTASTPFERAVLMPSYKAYATHLQTISPAEQVFLQAELMKFTMGRTMSQAERNLLISYLMPKKGGFGVATTRFEKGLRGMEFSYYRPDPIRIQLSLKEAISLTRIGKQPKAVDAFMRVLERHKASVITGGSITDQMYLGAAKKTPPHDVDMTVLGVLGEHPEALALEFTQALKPYYGSAVRVSPKRPSLVELKLGGTWDHAIDLHSKFGDVAASDVSVLSAEYVGYGMRTKPPILTKEGYLVMRLQEQIGRKGESVLRQRPFGVSPDAHRLKDVGSFLEGWEFKATYLGDATALADLAAFKATIPQEALQSFKATGGQYLITSSKYYAAPPRQAAFAVPSIATTYGLKAQAPLAKPISYDYISPPYKPLVSGYMELPSASLKLPSAKYDYGYKYDYKPSYPSKPVSPDYKYPSPKYPYKYPSPTYPYKYPSPKYPSKPVSPDYKYPSPKYPYKYPSPKYTYPYKAEYKYDYKYPYKYSYSYPYKYGYGYKPSFTFKPPPPSTTILKPPLPHLFAKPKEDIRFKRPSYRLKKGARSLYADLMSVMRTRKRYKKATHPSLRRRPYVWIYEENVFGRVPTVEMLEAKGKKRPPKQGKGLKRLWGKFKLSKLRIGKG